MIKVMFGFGKKKKKQEELDAAQKEKKQHEDEQKDAKHPPRKRGRIEKLIMGAIVGAAVGSVIGMTIAPKKGKETRKLIGEKSKEVLEKGKEIGKKLMEEPKADTPKPAPAKKGFFSLLKEKLEQNHSKPSASQKKASAKDEELDDILKKIPNERP